MEKVHPLHIHFAEAHMPTAGALVVGIAEGCALTRAAAELDAHSGGLLQRGLAKSNFSGKKGEFLTLVAPAGVAVGRVVLAGLGNIEGIDVLQLEALGGNVVGQLQGTGETEVAIWLGDLPGLTLAGATAAATLALGARLRVYRFDKYRTRLKPQERPTLSMVSVLCADPRGAEKAWASSEKIVEGVDLARDLVSEPGNVIYPETLASAALELKDLGVEVEILDVEAMKNLGMGALLGVGQGSSRAPRLVVMKWTGANEVDATQATFIGKGITFDSGGISLKEAAGLQELSRDMAGAAAIIGLMKSLSGRKAKANIVGVVAAAENMPDGNAQRPGDIVISMSGQSIAVDNTDAEGRLVLADALWYAQERFKPKVIVDIATLTGAIIVALGNEYGGLFSNDDELAIALVDAGKAVGEKLWRLPLDDAYDKLIDCDFADMKNISGSREAGSIVAAQFLQRFVNRTKWAHLDIAGMDWFKKDAGSASKGASGFGVRILDRFVAERFER